MFISPYLSVRSSGFWKEGGVFGGWWWFLGDRMVVYPGKRIKFSGWGRVVSDGGGIVSVGCRVVSIGNGVVSSRGRIFHMDGCYMCRSGGGFASCGGGVILGVWWVV